MCVFTDIILIMKNRHHHPRRSFLRDGKQHKKLRLNFTLRGEKGKPVRIALCCAAGLVLLVLLAMLLKPRTQLMNTPEIQRIAFLLILLTISAHLHYFLPPVLPTLRRMTSVVYLMPLPL